VVLGLVALAAACSGSNFSSDPHDAAPDASDGGAATGGSGALLSGGAGGSSFGGSAGADAAGGAGAGAGSEAGGEDAALDAELDGSVLDGGGLDGADSCVLVQYYFDGDGDGWGSTTTTSACTKPDGAWVTMGGDCDDGQVAVNPGQTSYFVVGYEKTGSSEISFDYDCSGVESEAGASPKAACQVQGLGCAGGGYIVALPVRSGPGVDPYCGSEQRVNCNYVNLKCLESAPYGAPAIACR
jgi:hypothetical protein